MRDPIRLENGFLRALVCIACPLLQTPLARHLAFGGVGFIEVWHRQLDGQVDDTGVSNSTGLAVEKGGC